MGYLYRPMLKGRAPGFTPTPDDAVLARGTPGDDPERCHHPRHGKEAVCPGCGARFAALWWMKYYSNGKAVRESTGTEKETEARRVLKDREGKVATGQPILPRVDRIRYAEAAKDLRQHYHTTGSRDLEEAEYRLAHLDAFFGPYRLTRIGPAEATAYVQQRQAEQASNGTINRELAILVRMLRLAYENGKLLRLPIIRQLEEAAPRSGFFERNQYEAVRRRLPDDLKVAVTIAHTYGWRIRSEVLSLQLRHVDVEAGTIRLDPGMTKNDDGRVVYLTPEVKKLLTAHIERVRALMQKTGSIIACLFPHLSGRREGTPRKDFRRAWRTACTHAGCPGMLRHDFRRTAVRNMVNAGVPERVAMAVTGHKTRAIFDRYHIVSPRDLQEMARRMGEKPAGSVASALDRSDRSV